MPRKSIWKKGDLSKASPEAYAAIQKLPIRDIRAFAIAAAQVMAKMPKPSRPTVGRNTAGGCIRLRSPHDLRIRTHSFTRSTFQKLKSF
jgi:hypothetical protein